MSIEYLNRLTEHSRTKGSDRAIMFALANRANKSGICWPSLERLARDAGITRRAVIRRLPKIETLGELVIERNGYPVQTNRGRQVTNIYKIHLPLVQPSDRQSLPLEQKGENGLNASSDRALSHEVTPCAKGSDSLSPKPSENRQCEPSTNRQTRPVGLSGQKIDYEKVKPPEITEYSDIDNPAYDPILIAMAITGERKKAGWGYWVKVLNLARERLGPKTAEEKFRQCCERVWGEARAGECERPGAILNLRLKETFGHDLCNQACSHHA